MEQALVAGLIPPSGRVLTVHGHPQDISARTEFRLQSVKGVKVDLVVPSPEHDDLRLSSEVRSRGRRAGNPMEQVGRLI
jgi:hypothetical protein